MFQFLQMQDPLRTCWFKNFNVTGFLVMYTQVTLWNTFEFQSFYLHDIEMMPRADFHVHIGQKLTLFLFLLNEQCIQGTFTFGCITVKTSNAQDVLSNSRSRDPGWKSTRTKNIRELKQTTDITKKGLLSKTIAIHVHYKSLYISLLSSAKQQYEMTKFWVVYGMWTTTDNFSYIH